MADHDKLPHPDMIAPIVNAYRTGRLVLAPMPLFKEISE